MTRPATLVLFALAVAAGGILFAIAFQVSSLEDRLTALNKDITSDRNAIHVLRAEWSYLNQPERLEGLTQRYLELQPLAAEQIAGAAALPMRQEDARLAQEGAAPADAPTAGETKLAGAFSALPREKPAAPRRPTRTVQLAAQPVVPALAATQDDRFEAVLRAVLGGAVGRYSEGAAR